MHDFIQVLLVDDHAVVREGYRRLLEPCLDLRVCGEASDYDSLLLQIQQHTVHVVVMDVALPGTSGIEITRRLKLRHPELGILISSMYDDAIFPARALEAGALGYVTKASPAGLLIEGIRRVARGQRYLSPDVAQALALRDGALGPTQALSPREFEVLRLLVAGHGLERIAQLVSLSPKTVANYQSSIKQKLGVDSPTQLLRAAAALGLPTAS